MAPGKAETQFRFTKTIDEERASVPWGEKGKMWCLVADDIFSALSTAFAGMAAWLAIGVSSSAECFPPSALPFAAAAGKTDNKANNSRQASFSPSTFVRGCRRGRRRQIMRTDFRSGTHDMTTATTTSKRRVRTLHGEHHGRVRLPAVVDQAEVGAGVGGAHRLQPQPVAVEVEVAAAAVITVLVLVAPARQLVVVAQQARALPVGVGAADAAAADALPLDQVDVGGGRDAGAGQRDVRAGAGQHVRGRRRRRRRRGEPVVQPVAVEQA